MREMLNALAALELPAPVDVPTGRALPALPGAPRRAGGEHGEAGDRGGGEAWVNASESGGSGKSAS